MMFKNSGAKARGVDFVLPSTGIEGTAYPLSTSLVLSAIKTFQNSDSLIKASEGNVAPLLEEAPESVAKIILKATRQDSEDEEQIAGVLDLPIEDLTSLLVACVDATLKGRKPKDFFAELIGRLGIDGISIRNLMNNQNQEIQDSMSGETESTMSQSPTPVSSEEEAELLG